MDTSVTEPTATPAADRRGDAVDRLRPGQRAPRQGVAPGALVVRGQRAAGHAGHRGVRRRPRPQLRLVDPRHRARLGHRDAVHGVPLGAGPQAGPAPDDPVAAAVRVLRGAAPGPRRGGAVHRLQRLQHADRGGHGPADRGDQPDHLDDHHLRDRVRLGHLRLPADPRVLPVGQHLVHRRVRAVRHRHPGRRPRAGRVLLLRHVQGGSVPARARRGAELPADLGALRVRVLALPPAQHLHGLGVLVDVPRVGHRGRLAGRARRLPGRRSTRRSPRRSPRSTRPGTRGSTAGASSCCCARGPAWSRSSA